MQRSDTRVEKDLHSVRKPIRPTNHNKSSSKSKDSQGLVGISERQAIGIFHLEDVEVLARYQANLVQHAYKKEKEQREKKKARTEVVDSISSRSKHREEKGQDSRISRLRRIQCYY